MSDIYEYLDSVSVPNGIQTGNVDPVEDQNSFSENFEYYNNIFGYSTEVVTLDNSNKINQFTPIVFLARIWNRSTNRFFTKEDATSVKFYLYKNNVYSSSFSEWVIQEEFNGIEIIDNSIVPIGMATWNYDDTEYNFIYIPNERLFNSSGSYYAQTKIFLTNERLPITITHAIKVFR